MIRWASKIIQKCPTVFLEREDEYGETSVVIWTSEDMNVILY